MALVLFNLLFIFLFFFYNFWGFLLFILFPLNIFLLRILYNFSFLFIRFELSVLLFWKSSINFCRYRRAIFFKKYLFIFTFNSDSVIFDIQGIFNLLMALWINFYVLNQRLILCKIRLDCFLILFIFALFLGLHLSNSNIDLLLNLRNTFYHRLPSSSFFIFIVIFSFNASYCQMW